MITESPSPWTNLVVVEHPDSVLSFLLRGEDDESVAPVIPVEVHHQPHLVDPAVAGKEGD